MMANPRMLLGAHALFFLVLLAGAANACFDYNQDCSSDPSDCCAGLVCKSISGGQFCRSEECIASNGDCSEKPLDCCEGFVCKDVSGEQACINENTCPTNPKTSFLEYVITQGIDGEDSKADVFVFEMNDLYEKTSLGGALVYFIDQSNPAVDPMYCYMVVNPDDSQPYATYHYPAEFDGCIDYRFIFCPLNASVENSEAGEEARIECLGSTGLTNLAAAPAKCPNALADPPVDYGNYLPSHSELYQCRKKPADMRELCWPLMLIFGLLIGASFTAGKNPFGMFDFYSPRMGRGKQYMPRMQNKSFDVTSYAMAASSAAQGIGKAAKGAKEKKAKNEAKKDTKKVEAKKDQLRVNNPGVSENKLTRMAKREVGREAAAGVKDTALSRGGLFGLIGAGAGKVMSAVTTKRTNNRANNNKVKTKDGAIIKKDGQNVLIGGQTAATYLSGKRDDLSKLQKGTKEYRQAKRELKQVERKVFRVESAANKSGSQAGSTSEKPGPQGTSSVNIGSSAYSYNSETNQFENKNQAPAQIEQRNTYSTTSAYQPAVTQGNALLNSLMGSGGIFSAIAVFTGKKKPKEVVQFTDKNVSDTLTKRGYEQKVMVKQGGKWVEAHVQSNGADGKPVYEKVQPGANISGQTLYVSDGKGGFVAAKGEAGSYKTETQWKFVKREGEPGHFASSMSARWSFIKDIFSQTWKSQGLDNKFRMDFNSGAGQAIASIVRLIALMAELSQYAQSIGTAFARVAVLGKLSKGITPIESMNNANLFSISQYQLTVGNLASWFSPSYAGGAGMPYLFSPLSQVFSSISANVQLKIAGKPPREDFSFGRQVEGLSFFKSADGQGFTVLDSNGKQLSGGKVLEHFYPALKGVTKEHLSSAKFGLPEFATIIIMNSDKETQNSFKKVFGADTYNYMKFHVENHFNNLPFNEIFNKLGATSVVLKTDIYGKTTLLDMTQKGSTPDELKANAAYNAQVKENIREYKNEMEKREFYYSSLLKYRQMAFTNQYGDTNRAARASSGFNTYTQFVSEKGLGRYEELIAALKASIKTGAAIGEQEKADIQMLTGRIVTDSFAAHDALGELKRMEKDHGWLVGYSASMSELMALEKQVDSIRKILGEIGKQSNLSKSAEFLMNEQARMHFYMANAEYARKAKHAVEEAMSGSATSLLYEAMKEGSNASLIKGFEGAKSEIANMKEGTPDYIEAENKQTCYKMAGDYYSLLGGQIPKGGLEKELGKEKIAELDLAYSTMNFNTISSAFWGLNYMNSASNLLSINSNASYGTGLAFELINQANNQLWQNTMSMAGTGEKFRIIAGVISQVNEKWGSTFQTGSGKDQLAKINEAGISNYDEQVRQAVADVLAKAIDVAKSDLSDKKALDKAMDQFAISTIDVTYLNSVARSYLGNLCTKDHEDEIKKRAKYLYDLKNEYESTSGGTQTLVISKSDTQITFIDDSGKEQTRSIDTFNDCLANNTNGFAKEEGMHYFTSKEYFHQSMQAGSDAWFGRPYFMSKPYYDYLQAISTKYSQTDLQAQMSGTSKPAGADELSQGKKSGWMRDFLGSFGGAFADDSKILYKKQAHTLAAMDWGTQNSPEMEKMQPFRMGQIPISQVPIMQPYPTRAEERETELGKYIDKEVSSMDKDSGAPLRYAGLEVSEKMLERWKDKAIDFMVEQNLLGKEFEAEVRAGNYSILDKDQAIVLASLVKDAYREEAKGSTTLERGGGKPFKGTYWAYEKFGDDAGALANAIKDGTITSLTVESNRGGWKDTNKSDKARIAKEIEDIYKK